MCKKQTALSPSSADSGILSLNASLTIRYSHVSQFGNTWNKGPSHSRTVQQMLPLNHVSDQKWRLHFKKKRWIKLIEVQLQENPRQESPICVWMISLDHVEQLVLTRLGNYFQVGSEDRNDVTFHMTENSLDSRFPKRAVHGSQSKQGH